MSNRLLVGTLIGLILLANLACRSGEQVAAEDSFDTVLLNGRVLDPESGLDAVKNIGIREGRIAAIADTPLRGRTVVDVAGLTVAPGFIDLHTHGQTARDGRLQVQDGVTTALDMESGVYPAATWYASREGHSPVNFGAGAGHNPARVKLKHGIDIGHRSTNQSHPELRIGSPAWSHEPATGEEIERLVGLIEQALNEGALGVSLATEYAPASSRAEVFRLFQLAARQGATVFVHVRASGMVEPGSGLGAIQEVVADAAATGASLHIVHLTSSALRSTPLALEMIETARARGVDISTEAYPYTAGSTLLASAYFSNGWQDRLGISFGGLQWSATGERLTENTFKRYRQDPGWVIMHMIPDEVADLAIRNPGVLIASDGIPFDTGGEHPRGAGTFSRVLGHYVRERGILSLMDGLRKMTLLPAQRLERFVPQMRQKGRIRVGADADITVFDPASVSDRATFEKPMQPSRGIVHVLVNGSFVVKESGYVEGISPGRAIRRVTKGAG